MISCSKCKRATLLVSDGGCIKTGGIVDIGCEYGQPRINTNYDRLVLKSPEELAAWIVDHPVVSEYDENNPKHKAWLDWLKQEAQDG